MRLMKMKSCRKVDSDGRSAPLLEYGSTMPAWKGIEASRANKRFENGPAAATNIIPAGDLLRSS